MRFRNFCEGILLTKNNLKSAHVSLSAYLITLLKLVVVTPNNDSYLVFSDVSRDGRRTVVMSSQDYESARRGAKAPQQSEGGKDRRKSFHGDISYRATDGRRYLSRWDRREGGDGT